MYSIVSSLRSSAALALAAAALCAGSQAHAAPCLATVCHDGICGTFDLCPVEVDWPWYLLLGHEDLYSRSPTSVYLVDADTLDAVFLGTSRAPSLSASDRAAAGAATRASRTFLFDPVSGLGQEVILSTNRAGDIVVDAVGGTNLAVLQ